MSKFLVVLLATACSATRQTKLLVEISRHGSRSSSEIFPLCDPPEDNFQIPERLTDYGAQQHYGIGSHIRSRYMTEENQLLSNEYNASEVYVQSTEVARTYYSAQSQLEGIYFLPLMYPDTDSTFTINYVDNNEDLDLHVSGSNCQRYSDIQSSVENSVQNQKVQNSISADYEANFIPRLRDLTDMPDASTETMFSVMDYLEQAQIAGLPLNVTLTDDDNKWIHASVNRGIWRDNLAQHDLQELRSYELLQQLNEFVEVLNGADWQDQPYFNKYFKGEAFPKFIFFSTHSETVLPMVQAFSAFYMEDPPVASNIQFEFFQENDLDWVSIEYNWDSTTTYQLLGDYSLRDDGAVTLDAFQSYVQAILRKYEQNTPYGTEIPGEGEAFVSTTEQICKVAYDGTNVPYWGAELWEKKFYTYFGLTSLAEQGRFIETALRIESILV